MILIDSHAHIYLKEFDDDRDQMMGRAREAGVQQILMPAIDSSTHNMMLGVEKSNPDLCRSMMGLHPCSVGENYLKELETVSQSLKNQKFVAVGEIGLDFYWDLSFKKQQYEAFHQQLDLALQYNLPVSIHSRNATDECIEVIRQHQRGNLKGVFHCFSGNADQARQLLELGFYLGIGGVLTFKNSGLDAVIRVIDLAHLVLETDAPYLAPTPFRGKRNEPAYLAQVIQKLADIKETTVENAAAVTTANTKKLFGL